MQCRKLKLVPMTLSCISTLTPRQPQWPVKCRSWSRVGDIGQ